MHGTKDSVVPYDNGQDACHLVGPPKYFITLPGANHGAPYVQGEASPQGNVVTRATIDFFDRYLKGDLAGITRLHKVVSDAGPKEATEQEQTG